MKAFTLILLLNHRKLQRSEHLLILCLTEYLTGLSPLREEGATIVTLRIREIFTAVAGAGLGMRR